MDSKRIRFGGGSGGHGCVSFLREKHRPFGGPDGGDGGHGGDVVLVASKHVKDLSSLRGVYRAENGKHGTGKERSGRCGESVIVTVPVGTVAHCEPQATEEELTPGKVS